VSLNTCALIRRFLVKIDSLLSLSMSSHGKVFSDATMKTGQVGLPCGWGLSLSRVCVTHVLLTNFFPTTGTIDADELERALSDFRTSYDIPSHASSRFYC
jgi:hypothetical protein